jgi:beta-glucosidase/6-phospho-beta-glucosidase/beta-galactosidase
MTRFDFPAGLLWSTTTAAHQVEGNNVNSDRRNEWQTTTLQLRTNKRL